MSALIRAPMLRSHLDGLNPRQRRAAEHGSGRQDPGRRRRQNARDGAIETQPSVSGCRPAPDLPGAFSLAVNFDQIWDLPQAG
jgi:hypothetical protein